MFNFTMMNPPNLSGNPSPPEVLPLVVKDAEDNQIREGEQFILSDFGTLTGLSTVKINGISCTSIVLINDNTQATMFAPADGVVYNTEFSIILEFE